jgi:hypothetical protein
MGKKVKKLQQQVRELRRQMSAQYTVTREHAERLRKLETELLIRPMPGTYGAMARGGLSAMSTEFVSQCKLHGDYTHHDINERCPQCVAASTAANNEDAEWIRAMNEGKPVGLCGVHGSYTRADRDVNNLACPQCVAANAAPPLFDLTGLHRSQAELKQHQQELDAIVAANTAAHQGDPPQPGTYGAARREDYPTMRSDDACVHCGDLHIDGQLYDHFHYSRRQQREADTYAAKFLNANTTTGDQR